MSVVIVLAAIIEEIRQHAESAEPGMEIVGRLEVDEDGVAVRYVPLVNLSREPGRARIAASWRRTPGRRSVIVHSHPRRSLEPSADDLAYRWHGGRFGIFAGGTLGVFRIDADAPNGYRHVPVLIGARREPVKSITAAAAPPSSPGPPRGLLVDVARREVRDRNGKLVEGGYGRVAARLEAACRTGPKPFSGPSSRPVERPDHPAARRRENDGEPV